MPEAAGFHAPRPIPADKVDAIKEAVRIDLAAIEKKEHKCVWKQAHAHAHAMSSRLSHPFSRRFD